MVVVERVGRDELARAAARGVRAAEFQHAGERGGELEGAAVAHEHLCGTPQHQWGRKRRRRHVQLPALRAVAVPVRFDRAPHVAVPRDPAARVLAVEDRAYHFREREPVVRLRFGCRAAHDAPQSSFVSVEQG